MHDEATNKPVKVFRCGAVQAAIWTNPRVIDNAVVEVPSVRIDKSYNEGDEWKKTTSFAAEDLFATRRSAPDEEPSRHEET